MKNLILSFIVSINLLSTAQWSDNGNYIRNNSFEQVNYVVWESLCQTVMTNEDPLTGNGTLHTGHCPTAGTTPYEYHVEYWDQIEFWTVPDQKYDGPLFHSYVGTPDLLTNTHTSDFTFGTARTGEAWAGMVADEALIAELEEPLIPGEIYYMEFFVNEKDNEFTYISLYDEKPIHHNGDDGIGKTIEENNKDQVRMIHTFVLTLIGTTRTETC